MSSSPPQDNLSPSLSSSASSESQEIPTEVQHDYSQLEPANLLSPLGLCTARDVAADVDRGSDGASDAKSVSSGRSSKFGFRKRFSRFFKGGPKAEKPIPTSAASSTSTTLLGTEERIHSAAPDRKAVPVSLGLHSPAHSAEMSSTPLITQPQPSLGANGTLRVDIFPENVIKPIYKTDLPKPHARVDKTPQLVYCCRLLSKAQEPPPPTSDNDFTQDSPLNDEENEWVQLIDPVLRGRYRWLVE
ncbi:hypothetical protein BGZ91_005654, partial [Linnemannia elongata]